MTRLDLVVRGTIVLAVAFVAAYALRRASAAARADVALGLIPPLVGIAI